MSDRDPPAGPLPAAVLQALVEQSLELIAITDGAGTIAWANARFSAATGVFGGDATRLVDCAAEGAAGESTRDKLGAGLAAGTLEATGLRLRATDGSLLWVDARARRAAELVLWSFTDVSSTRFLAAQAIARASCSTSLRSSAASACGSGAFLPAKAAGTATCSASGDSTRRRARRRSRRRSSASIPTTGRR
jgi:hypothetical protein